MKVLLTAGELRKLITPEAEIELVSTAAGQIAGQLTAKVMEKLPNLKQEIDRLTTAHIEAVRSQTKGLATASRLHDDVKAVIRAFLDTEVKSAFTKLTADACLARADDLIKARMQKVEQEIAAGVKTATDLMRGQIEALAQEKFMELIRGAGKIGA